MNDVINQTNATELIHNTTLTDIDWVDDSIVKGFGGNVSRARHGLPGADQNNLNNQMSIMYLRFEPRPSVYNYYRPFLDQISGDKKGIFIQSETGGRHMLITKDPINFYFIDSGTLLSAQKVRSDDVRTELDALFKNYVNAADLNAYTGVPFNQKRFSPNPDTRQEEKDIYAMQTNMNIKFYALAEVAKSNLAA
jgi:hypothetical protein